MAGSFVACSLSTTASGSAGTMWATRKATTTTPNRATAASTSRRARYVNSIGKRETGGGAASGGRPSPGAASAAQFGQGHEPDRMDRVALERRTDADVELGLHQRDVGHVFQRELLDLHVQRRPLF